jgi:hypothetical protein
MKQLNPKEIISSDEFKSVGALSKVTVDKPNRVLNQFRKKKVGPRKYRIKNNIVANTGKRSQKNKKNNTSAIKKIEPGNPKNIKRFIKATKNNLGQEKFIPLISVIKRVLKRRFIISTIKNELEERRA